MATGEAVWVKNPIASREIGLEVTDKPKTQKQEPTPRPPRQPDLALITYLEKGADEEAEETEEAESPKR